MPAKIRKIQSGELRNVCNLEALVMVNGQPEVDATGSPTARYIITAENVRCAVDDWKPYETFQSKQVIDSLSTRIRIRYRPGMEGIGPNMMRIVLITNPGASPPVLDYYDILGCVRDPTLRIDLTITCMRRDAAGFRTGATP